MKPDHQQDRQPEMICCFRPDGSFDLGLFLRSPQVLSGLIFVAAGILGSIAVNLWVASRSRMLSMFLLMFCTFTCLSGGDTLVRCINFQLQAKNKNGNQNKKRK